MPSTGALIVNADDWGRTRPTTDRILECVERRAVSSVSAMVFMEDSERAAFLARERNVDAGLHLNLTTPFSAKSQGRLTEHQGAVSRHLLRHRLAQAVFHPGLRRSFEYLVAAQLEEFERLFSTAPSRIDGHHHMHLCANVLLQKLLPEGTVVRRSFSFQLGEKSRWNLIYRRWVDSRLARRHRMTDYFFSLAPLEPASRLEHIFRLAGSHIVELETHPVVQEEYEFLASDELFRRAGNVPVACGYTLAEAVKH